GDLDLDLDGPASGGFFLYAHDGSLGLDFCGRRRFLADVEGLMTTDPRPAWENGTRLRAMASSIRRATSGRASVDAPSTSTQRDWLDPCNSFSGSGNSLPRWKYSRTPFASARIPRTPSYPRSFGE